MTTGEDDFSPVSLDDPQLYPHVYTHNYDVWVVGIGGASITGCILILFGRDIPIQILVVTVFIFLASAYELLHYYRFRLVLEHNIVKLTNPFSHCSIHRDAIAGKRISYNHLLHSGMHIDPRPAARITLVPKDASVTPLTFTLKMNTDEVIDQWLASLPDLDQREQAAIISAFLDDAAFDKSEKKRAARLAFARSAATTANIASETVSFGSLLLWHETAFQPAIFVVIAAIPLLALATIIMTKGFYSARRIGTFVHSDFFQAILLPLASVMNYMLKGSYSAPSYFFHPEELRKERLPNLRPMLVFPSIILLLLGVEDAGAILDWRLAILILIAVGVVVALFVVWLRTRTPVLPAIIILPAVFWSSGLVLNYNDTFDQSKPSIYRSRIIAKRETTGKHSVYYLKLSAWGSQTRAHEVSVTYEAYNTYPVDAEVCVYVHKGALGMSWWDFDICSNNSPPPVPAPELDRKNFIRLK